MVRGATRASTSALVRIRTTVSAGWATASPIVGVVAESFSELAPFEPWPHDPSIDAAKIATAKGQPRCDNLEELIPAGMTRNLQAPSRSLNHRSAPMERQLRKFMQQWQGVP